MTQPIDTASQAQLFTQARTHSHWQAKPVPENLQRQLYDLCKWGPSSANCSPLRVVFVQSPAAKAQLKSCLQAGNIDKTMTAPVTAILAMDMQFYEKLPQLFPHADAKSWFAGNDALIAETAFRNSSLQCAYFMLAARALGLDCGPLSGFDRKKCDALFFAGTPVQSNMLCNLGYGDSSKLQPRLPRLDFADACRIA